MFLLLYLTNLKTILLFEVYIFHIRVNVMKKVVKRAITVLFCLGFLLIIVPEIAATASVRLKLDLGSENNPLIFDSCDSLNYNGHAWDSSGIPTVDTSTVYEGTGSIAVSYNAVWIAYLRVTTGPQNWVSTPYIQVALRYSNIENTSPHPYRLEVISSNGGSESFYIIPSQANTWEVKLFDLREPDINNNFDINGVTQLTFWWNPGRQFAGESINIDYVQLGSDSTATPTPTQTPVVTPTPVAPSPSATPTSTPLPTATLTPLPSQYYVTVSPTDLTINENEEVTFSTLIFNGLEPYSYQWFLNNTLLNSQTESVAIENLSVGTYVVKIVVSDSVNNSDFDEAVLKVQKIENENELITTLGFIKGTSQIVGFLLIIACAVVYLKFR